MVRLFDTLQHVWAKKRVQFWLLAFLASVLPIFDKLIGLFVRGALLAIVCFACLLLLLLLSF
jgi:hypothetical protein